MVLNFTITDGVISCTINRSSINESSKTRLISECLHHLKSKLELVKTTTSKPCQLAVLVANDSSCNQKTVSLAEKIYRELCQVEIFPHYTIEKRVEIIGFNCLDTQVLDSKARRLSPCVRVTFTLNM
ncbi:uncharacterized protein LOC128883622 [Hylaeus volcanicus]|uniref:uncharacterized protein LOC128883622 n=1 Tax=Hylaeus volcanicus TaxID=313075 RepID=UPI0023B7B21B|nr:uncharacterized protein LOC128883622 [Hylaeus volcanicus]